MLPESWQKKTCKFFCRYMHACTYVSICTHDPPCVTVSRMRNPKPLSHLSKRTELFTLQVLREGHRGHISPFAAALRGLALPQTCCASRWDHEAFSRGCCPANVLPLPCAGQQLAAPASRDIYIRGERQFGEMQRSVCTCCSHLNT